MSLPPLIDHTIERQEMMGRNEAGEELPDL
jgi:hypothetical protein